MALDANELRRRIEKLRRKATLSIGAGAREALRRLNQAEKCVDRSERPNVDEGYSFQQEHRALHHIEQAEELLRMPWEPAP
jgi:hypothetical protein